MSAGIVLDLKLEKEPQTLYQWTSGLSEKPENADFTKSLLLTIAGEYEKAIQLLKKVIEKDDKDAEAYLQMGYCYTHIGQFQNGINAYGQAISLKSDYADAYNNLSTAHLHLNNHDDAIGVATKRMAPLFQLFVQIVKQYVGQ